MKITKSSIVTAILEGRLCSPVNQCAEAFAPSNIALCKYWGKRDLELNLPVNSSLSISLANRGAYTRLQLKTKADLYIVNGKPIAASGDFAMRLQKFLNLFRPKPSIYYRVETNLNIPIAGGLASSASGFAALVMALNNLYNWGLDKSKLSILARLGSGSASRSFWPGFVKWQEGKRSDGMDSFGVPLPYTWPDLRLGLLPISSSEKYLSSREAMQRTVETSPLYAAWPLQATIDLANLESAIINRDFEFFGKTAEANASMMHEMMVLAKPPINYSLPETYRAIEQIHKLQSFGAEIFFTQDAGPNLVLLFLDKDVELVKEIFPEVEIVLPFADVNEEYVTLVDNEDNEIGTSEKIRAHLTGNLHRAFSVFIVRHRKNKIELLLQKRQITKYHSGGLWSNTCCGHPLPNENPQIAAMRRLQEEMGFSTNLQPVGNFHYKTKLNNDLIENEIDHVFIGLVDEIMLKLNLDEVSDYAWIELKMLQKDLAKDPNKYTAWLMPALDLILQKSNDADKAKI